MQFIGLASIITVASVFLVTNYNQQNNQKDHAEPTSLAIDQYKTATQFTLEACYADLQPNCEPIDGNDGLQALNLEAENMILAAADTCVRSSQTLAVLHPEEITNHMQKVWPGVKCSLVKPPNNQSYTVNVQLTKPFQVNYCSIYKDLSFVPKKTGCNAESTNEVPKTTTTAEQGVNKETVAMSWGYTNNRELGPQGNVEIELEPSESGLGVKAKNLKSFGGSALIDFEFNYSAFTQEKTDFSEKGISQIEEQGTARAGIGLNFSFQGLPVVTNLTFCPINKNKTATCNFSNQISGSSEKNIQDATEKANFRDGEERQGSFSGGGQANVATGQIAWTNTLYNQTVHRQWVSQVEKPTEKWQYEGDFTRTDKLNPLTGIDNITLTIPTKVFEYWPLKETNQSKPSDPGNSQNTNLPGGATQPIEPTLQHQHAKIAFDKVKHTFQENMRQLMLSGGDREYGPEEALPKGQKSGAWSQTVGTKTQSGQYGRWNEDPFKTIYHVNNDYLATTGTTVDEVYYPLTSYNNKDSIQVEGDTYHILPQHIILMYDHNTLERLSSVPVDQGGIPYNVVANLEGFKEQAEARGLTVEADDTIDSLPRLIRALNAIPVSSQNSKDSTTTAPWVVYFGPLANNGELAFGQESYPISLLTFVGDLYRKGIKLSVYWKDRCYNNAIGSFLAKGWLPFKQQEGMGISFDGYLDSTDKLGKSFSTLMQCNSSPEPANTSDSPSSDPESP